MATFQLKLPIQRASEYGFKHITSVESSVWQDLISLLLTIPGEKINDPEFGIGLQTYIFEQDSELLKQEIEIKIREKVFRYLPFITIDQVIYTVEDNFLLITIKYYIGSSTNLDQVTLKLNSDSN